MKMGGAFEPCERPYTVDMTHDDERPNSFLHCRGQEAEFSL